MGVLLARTTVHCLSIRDQKRESGHMEQELQTVMNYHMAIEN